LWMCDFGVVNSSDLAFLNFCIHKRVTTIYVSEGCRKRKMVSIDPTATEIFSRIHVSYVDLSSRKEIVKKKRRRELVWIFADLVPLE